MWRKRWWRHHNNCAKIKFADDAKHSMSARITVCLLVARVLLSLPFCRETLFLAALIILRWVFVIFFCLSNTGEDWWIDFRNDINLTLSYTGRGGGGQKVIALILIVNNFVDIRLIVNKFLDFSWRLKFLHQCLIRVSIFHIFIFHLYLYL